MRVFLLCLLLYLFRAVLGEKIKVSIVLSYVTLLAKPFSISLMFPVFLSSVIDHLQRGMVYVHRVCLSVCLSVVCPRFKSLAKFKSDI